MVMDLWSPARERGARLGLLAVVAVAYLPALGASWAWDDPKLLAQNPILQAPIDWSAIWRSDFFGEPGASGYYRPLALLTFAVDRALAPDSAAWAHAHTLAWHLAAVDAVLRLLGRLAPPGAALLGAALFGLHPASIEAVAWVSGRNDPMAVAFGALGTALLLERGRARMALGALSLFGALLCKESAVSFLALPLLLAAVTVPRDGIALRIASVGVAGALLLAVRAMADVQGIASSVEGPALPRAIQALGSWSLVALLPWPLTISRSLDWPAQSEVAAVGGVVVAAALGLALAQRGGAVAWAGLAFVGAALAPPLYAVSAFYDRAAERYLYLPLVGAAIVAARAASGASVRTQLALGLAGSLPAFLVLQARLPDWHDHVSLFEAAWADSPSPLSAGELGTVYLAEGRAGDGVRMLTIALSDARPNCAAALPLVRATAPATDSAPLRAALATFSASGCDVSGPALAAWLALAMARVEAWEEADRLARAAESAAAGDPHAEVPRVWRPVRCAAAVALRGEAGWNEWRALCTGDEDRAARRLLPPSDASRPAADAPANGAGASATDVGVQGTADGSPAREE